MKHPLLKAVGLGTLIGLSTLTFAKTSITGDSNAVTIATDIPHIKYVTLQGSEDFQLTSTDLHITPNTPLKDGVYRLNIFASKGIKALKDNAQNGRDTDNPETGEVVKRVKTKRFAIEDGQVTKLNQKEQ